MNNRHFRLESYNTLRSLEISFFFSILPWVGNAIILLNEVWIHSNKKDQVKYGRCFIITVYKQSGPSNRCLSYGEARCLNIGSAVLHAWHNRVWFRRRLNQIDKLRKESFCLFHTSTLHNKRINDFASVVERNTFNKHHGVVEVRAFF